MSNRAILPLLTCVLLYLLLESAKSNRLTVSSKLVHRFSDEAKAVWISRSHGKKKHIPAWPKKNTLEYLHLLLANDLSRQQRRKMIATGGPQSQLLFPSQGSRTLFFGNDLDWLHYAWVDIGTPNVSFLVALDAGSDLFWVPCDCLQCAPLSASHYTSLDRDLSEYSPSLSNTSRHLPCGHQLCQLSSSCDNLKEPCPYMVTYDDPGNTSSSGILIEDKLHLASVSGHAIEGGVQASVIVGCGRKQTGSYLEGAAPDGLMGLGPGNISVTSLLAKAGLTRNSFSLCFDENESGRILFGDQGHDSQQSTPFLPLEGNYAAYIIGVDSYCVGTSCLKGSGFKALVDSGSSFTFVPTEVYDKVVVEFDRQVNAKRIRYREGLWDYCYNVSSYQLHDIPSVRLLFFMNQSFVVHNPTYTISQNQDYTKFCLTLQPIDGDYGIIGQNFMTGYNMVFDMEDLKLRWSNSKCLHPNDSTDVDLKSPANNGSANTVPSNDQRSIPSTHAVAPAVAGRTDLKTSAASQQFCLTNPLLLVLLVTVFLLIF